MTIPKHQILPPTPTHPYIPPYTCTIYFYMCINTCTCVGGMKLWGFQSVVKYTQPHPIIHGPWMAPSHNTRFATSYGRGSSPPQLGVCMFLPQLYRLPACAIIHGPWMAPWASPAFSLSLSVAICLALYLPLSRLLSLLLVLHCSVSGSPPGSLWLLLHIPFRLSLSSSGYLSGSLSLWLSLPFCCSTWLSLASSWLHLDFPS